MSAIERNDDDIPDEQPEPVSEPAPPTPKAGKEDKRKKPRTEKQIAAFELMREKRKALIAQKKELAKTAQAPQAPQAPSPPLLARTESVQPSVVNNYFYSEYAPPPHQEPPTPRARPRAPTPEPDTEPPEPEPQTYAREIYFG